MGKVSLYDADLTVVPDTEVRNVAKGISENILKELLGKALYYAPTSKYFLATVIEPEYRIPYSLYSYLDNHVYTTDKNMGIAKYDSLKDLVEDFVKAFGEYTERSFMVKDHYAIKDE